MTPENHSDPEPSLRQVVLQDLRPGEVPDSFRRGWRELYFFYLEPSRREELASLGWARRTFLLLSWLFKSLLRKLAPQRRIMLLAALLLFVLGWVEMVLIAGIEVRMLAFLILLVLLMLELKDKLVARSEIEIARQVQCSLLPTEHPHIPGWDVWSGTRPANDVGGDLVDYLDPGPGRHGLTLGDVAGKGMGAALLMAKLQATLRALAPDLEDLRDLGSRLNALLHRDGPSNRFATLFYLEVRPGSGAVRYLNAGHNPALVVRLGGMEKLAASATPLGMLPEVSYRESHIEMLPGDLFLAYSDGVTEAENSAGQEFGMSRLESLLPSLRSLPAAEVGRRVEAAVSRHLDGERPGDDLSLLIVRRTKEDT